MRYSIGIQNTCLARCPYDRQARQSRLVPRHDGSKIRTWKSGGSLIPTIPGAGMTLRDAPERVPERRHCGSAIQMSPCASTSASRQSNFSRTASSSSSRLAVRVTWRACSGVMVAVSTIKSTSMLAVSALGPVQCATDRAAPALTAGSLCTPSFLGRGRRQAASAPAP